MRRLALFVFAATLGVVGCKKRAPGDVGLKQVNDALVEAGYKLDSFHPSDPGHLGAQSCTSGSLGGVETLVCEFAGPDGSARGKKAAEDWVAQAPTGVVLLNGRTLLALADRNHADPQGKTMHQICKAYQALK